MRKPLAIIALLFITAFMFASPPDKKLVIKKIKKYRGELVAILKKTGSADKTHLVALVGKITNLISRMEEDRMCSKYCTELILYAKQTLAGIYIHRLSKPLDAIKNYLEITKHPYFIKKANPLIKWLVFEGIGIAYRQRNNPGLAKKSFILSLAHAKAFKKVNKSKGRLCIQSSAFNLATVYASEKNAGQTLKMLELAFKNCLNNQERRIIVISITTNDVFLFIKNNRKFNLLIK